MCPQTSMMEKKRRRTLASMSKAAMTASDPNHWAWETANDDAEKLMRRERKAAAREAYWDAYARAVQEHNARHALQLGCVCTQGHNKLLSYIIFWQYAQRPAGLAFP